MDKLDAERIKGYDAIMIGMGPEDHAGMVAAAMMESKGMHVLLVDDHTTLDLPMFQPGVWHDVHKLALIPHFTEPKSGRERRRERRKEERKKPNQHGSPQNTSKLSALRKRN